MIEYANEAVMKLLKQYDMLSKSLEFTVDLKQQNDICEQMTKIIQSVIELTNASYENKYKRVEKRSVYLMDEEKTRLLELINLVNERRTYVNNQITTNKELTGINIDSGIILGEDKIEEYKNQVKIIDKYKNNIRLESILQEEIKRLDVNIRKANEKINNNKTLNKQLEEKMINMVEKTLQKLSLYELTDREKEIDLAYTELGYSLEKAKENAKIARRDCTEEIILECDNMLASITLEYERYKEKKLILRLINIFKKPVNNYRELLNKREEINNILINITSSELYSIIGAELNKEYATIKLEQQDVATLKSLMEEKDTKSQNLEEIKTENNSDIFKGLLSNLLENEKRYQEKLLQEQKKKEQEQLERKRQEEKKQQEELAKRQKQLEEERKKEIERRTKQLLVEKQNSILMPTREEKNKEALSEHKITKASARPSRMANPTTKKDFSAPTPSRVSRTEVKAKNPEPRLASPERVETSKNITPQKKDDFFTREKQNTKVIDKGIPVIKNNKLENVTVTAKKQEAPQNKVFPEIPLEKKENIFPDFPEINNNSAFFDENEFNDLSNYMENDNKNSWF